MSTTTTLLLVCLFVSSVCCQRRNDRFTEDGDDDGKHLKSRDQRFFSIFTIVRFPNDACRAESGDNGTCVTSNECTRSSGGTASGTCASGFGVCCVFSGECDGSTNRNCTYFENPGSSLNEARNCQFRISKCSDNVCQLRLDFETFVLAQPDDIGADADNSLTTGQCNTDMFRVSGGPSNTVGTLCGTNTGQHVYYDVGPGSGDCSISISTTTNSFNRQWKIKITQVPCCSEVMAPPGCTQYYTGVAGMIQSFNWMTNNNEPNGIHLADQKQVICIRPEAGYCTIQYRVDTTVMPVQGDGTAFTNPGSFLIQTTAVETSTVPDDCDVIADSPTYTDFISIPCGSDATAMMSADRYCGEALNGGAAAMTHNTITGGSRLFNLVFTSNSDEASEADMAGGTTQGYRGFKLLYSQVPC